MRRDMLRRWHARSGLAALLVIVAAVFAATANADGRLSHGRAIFAGLRRRNELPRLARRSKAAVPAAEAASPA